MAVALIGSCLAPAVAPAAGVYYVDNASAACSNTGPGTEAQPYCTIAAAVAARGGPGTTILVKPGLYREQIVLGASGLPGSPFRVQALGRVTVDGADDLSSSAAWAPASGAVFLAASVTWTPKQVFVDGTRLAPSSLAPDALPVNAFAWISGEGLYVNLGGASPGTRQTLVGRRAYGFYASARSDVAIEGFHVTRAQERCIQLTGCTNTTVARDTLTFSGKFGLQISGGSGHLVESNSISDNADHGMSLTSGLTGSTIQDNESFRNAHPTVRSANGIYMFGAPGNLIRRNRLHDNQDSGLQIQSGSNDNVCYLNRSWRNGDHGYDHLFATGNLHVCDVAYANYKDGFSIEGNSTGHQLYDCIAVDNGVSVNPADGPLEYNLYVDAGSLAGFVSDYNLFWNSTSAAPVAIGVTPYATVAAYSAATGQDAHTLQADPRFVDAAAGDFRLSAGSPAIDSGHSGVPSWPAADALGNGRADDPATPDAGAGPIAYADRGAFEYLPPAGSPNLVGNPSFESGTAGWAPFSGATIARVTGGHDGAHSLLVTGRGSSSFGVDDSPDWVAPTPGAGRRLRFSAWVRSASHTGSVRLRVREFSGTTQLSNVSSASRTLSPVWQELTLDYVVRSAGTRIDFQVIDAPRVSRESFRVDAVSIRDVTGLPAAIAAALPAGAEAGSEAEADVGAEAREPGDRADPPLQARLTPSPLRSSGTLELATSGAGSLRAALYDVAGRRVRSLLDEPRAAAGIRRVPVDGTDDRGRPLGPGIYFFRVESGREAITGRFVVAR